MHKSESYNINAVQLKISKRCFLLKGLCLLFEQYIMSKKRDSNQRQEGKTSPKSAPYTDRLCNQFYWQIYILIMISRWSGPAGSNCWTSIAPAFRCWFAVEYSCFISVMIPDIYVRCVESLVSRGPSRGPNNFYV